MQVAFVRDCAAHDVKAVSFGGGEPLPYGRIFEVLGRLRGVLFRSLTTNGLTLDAPALDRLAEAAPEKVHISIHFPERPAEVERVIRQLGALAGRGLRTGINLLVARSNLEAAAAVRAAGIGNDPIVYLPMRGRDTPAPDEMALVAGREQFQSMTCLMACGTSPSLRVDRLGPERCLVLLSHRLVYLSQAGIVALTDETGLVGHDGWADGRLGDYAGSAVLLNDHLLIEELSGLDKDDRLGRLHALGDEAAAHFRTLLPEALGRFRRLLVLTHVPPSREACWHRGRVSDDDCPPHFSCRAVGEVLSAVLAAHPECEMTVLCGNTHSPGEVQILSNLRVPTDGAEYGRPALQRVLVVG